MKAVVASLVALIALGGAVMADARDAASCGEANGQTVKRTPQVRVFRDKGGSRYRVCWRKTGQTTLMQRTSESGTSEIRVRKITTRGRFVAWESWEVEASLATSIIGWIDARSGKRRFVLAGPQDYPASVDEGDGVQRLRANRRGDLAWILRNPRTLDHRLEVHLFTGDDQHLLDHGSGVDPTQLTLTRSSVTWVRDGVEQRFAFR